MFRPRVGASRCRISIKASTCVARTQVPTSPREHGQSHVMPAVIVQVRRTKHPICEKQPALCPPCRRVAALAAIPDEVQSRSFGSVGRTDGVGANATHT